MQGRRSDAILWYYIVPGMQMARLWALEDGSELRKRRVDVEYEPCVLTITRIDMCRCWRTSDNSACVRTFDVLSERY
jgi:hypothetical protein